MPCRPPVDDDELTSNQTPQTGPVGRLSLTGYRANRVWSGSCGRKRHVGRHGQRTSRTRQGCNERHHHRRASAGGAPLAVVAMPRASWPRRG